MRFGDDLEFVDDRVGLLVEEGLDDRAAIGLVLAMGTCSMVRSSSGYSTCSPMNACWKKICNCLPCAGAVGVTGLHG